MQTARYAQNSLAGAEGWRSHSTSAATVTYSTEQPCHDLSSRDSLRISEVGSQTVSSSFPGCKGKLGRFLCKDSVMYFVCFFSNLVVKIIHFIAFIVLAHDR